MAWGTELTSLWDWMQNKQVLDQLQRSTVPVVDPQSVPPYNRPAPAAGRSGSISPETRESARQYGIREEVLEEQKAKMDVADKEARAKRAAKFRLAGQTVKTAADFLTPEERPVLERMATAPTGQSPELSGPTASQIQAAILNRPSVVTALFGGYGDYGR